MKTDNELIAEFMGWSKDAVGLWLVPSGYANRIRVKLFSTDQLIFDESWDWLMPVVEKIESIGINVDIFREGTKIKWMKKNDDYFCYNSMFHNETSKISHVYRSIVEFIKWYNSQTHHP